MDFPACHDDRVKANTSRSDRSRYHPGGKCFAGPSLSDALWGGWAAHRKFAGICGCPFSQTWSSIGYIYIGYIAFDSSVWMEFIPPVAWYLYRWWFWSRTILATREAVPDSFKLSFQAKPIFLCRQELHFPNWEIWKTQTRLSQAHRQVLSQQPEARVPRETP
jgi:hypothetical protein